MKKYNIAVVGATGLVGRKMIEVLAEENINIKNLYAYASKKSQGMQIKFNSKKITVLELTEKNIKGKKIDFALFSAGGEVSKIFAPIFASIGAVVVDNSSYFRQDESVPLVVPEVNPEDILWHKNIISNPNCSTIQAVVALSQLDKAFKIKRIIYSTYQAVSGAGKQGINDLISGQKGEPAKKFPHKIFNNLIPQIDVFLPNLYTKEEQKMIDETKKILHNKNLKITATCVRVPVLFGHSESINVSFENKITLDEVKNILHNSKGVVVIDKIEENLYPMPIYAENKNQVFVGRIRIDNSEENSINLWVVADNIRKGAATNAVQIVKLLIDKKEGKWKVFLKGVAQRL